MKVKVKLLSPVWTAAYQAPQSMEFTRQEYWSGLPFPSPEDLPNPGIKPGSPALQAGALPSEPPGKPKESKSYVHIIFLKQCRCFPNTQYILFVFTFLSSLPIFTLGLKSMSLIHVYKYLIFTGRFNVPR